MYTCAFEFRTNSYHLFISWTRPLICMCNILHYIYDILLHLKLIIQLPCRPMWSVSKYTIRTPRRHAKRTLSRQTSRHLHHCCNACIHVQNINCLIRIECIETTLSFSFPQHATVTNTSFFYFQARYP